MFFDEYRPVASALSTRTRKNLKKLGVRHVEQLASIFADPVARAAAERLNLIPKTTWSEAEKSVDQVLQREAGVSISSPRDGGFDVANGQDYRLLSTPPAGYGYALDSNSNLSSLRLFTTIPISAQRKSTSREGGPRKLSVLKDLPRVTNQGYRGTCVAFATTALLEVLIRRSETKHKRFERLSEQMLFNEAKARDRRKESDGTQFGFAAKALTQHGVCKNSVWSYIDKPDWSHDLLFEKPVCAKKELRKLGQAHMRIKDYELLNAPISVKNIKDSIIAGLPVALAVMTFNRVWTDGPGQEYGEVILPLIDERPDEIELLEEPSGAHAIAIYGFDEQPDESGALPPGGGRFLFRNSWGEEWGYSHYERAGYGYMPYKYVEYFGVSAMTIKELHPDIVRKVKTNAKHGKTTTSGRSRATSGGSRVSKTRAKRSSKTK